MLLIMQGVDCRQGIGIGPHFDKSKSATSSRLAVNDNLGAAHLAKWSKNFPELGITNPV
jgi:hypothetical protein